MKQLIHSAKQVVETKDALPFSIYTSIEEQHIVNVPIIKPVMICVLDGCKSLGKHQTTKCHGGNFVFLSNNPTLELRNIPTHKEYVALLIEFDFNDFAIFKPQRVKTTLFFQGAIDATLKNTLQQFVDWSSYAPSELWPRRRQEILQLLFLSGYKQVSHVAKPSDLRHQLHNIISANINNDLSANTLASQLAMSESTLRRRLKAQGSSLQEIKDNARLGYGLHLVQTSFCSIGQIAEKCGYQSQSRFTEKFKHCFGITPTQLRKTRLSE